MFCDTYLAAYLTHLLRQALEGKSGEAAAREVVETMADLCERRGVFPRRLPEMQKKPLRWAGLRRLWHILQNQSPSIMQRLSEAHICASRPAVAMEYVANRQNDRI
jgi:hypothetical protein